MNEPDGNVHVMPKDREHFETKDCWCGPELIDDFTEDGGNKLYLHKEIQ